MSIPTWGMLEKSQEDNETIEGAIDRLITAHLADDNAHLGEGESLQSHRASEIIDHLAESVITDKIAERNVTIDHLSDFGSMWRLSLPIETIDGWDIGISGTASIFANIGELGLQAGYNASPNYYCYGAAPTRTVLSTKTFRTRAILKTIATYTGFNAYLTTGPYSTGESEVHGVGWKITNGVLYAVHRSANGSGSTEYATEILNLAANTYYNLEIIYTPETSIEFYINDVLVTTHDTNLPDTEYYFGNAFNVRFQTTAAGTHQMYLYSLYIQQEL